MRRRLRDAGQEVREHRHLALTVEAIDVATAPCPASNVAMFSSGTLPSRVDGTVSCADRRRRSPFALPRAQVHFVLLAALVVCGHLIAADQQPQRLGGVGDLHAEIGRLRRSRWTDSSGLPTFSDVSTSTTPGMLARLVDAAAGEFLQLAEIGPVDSELDVRVLVAAATDGGDRPHAVRRLAAANCGRTRSRTSSMTTN